MSERGTTHRRFVSLPLASTPQPTSQLQLHSLSSREVFGDYELLEDCLRVSTCTCTSPLAQVYVVSKSVLLTQDFIKRFHDQKTISFLKDRANIEKHWLNDRFNDLINVEKYKKQFWEWNKGTDKTDLTRFTPKKYENIKKELLYFANIHHNRANSELLSPKFEGGLHTEPTPTTRNHSSMGVYQRFGTLQSKSRLRHRK